MQTRKLLYGVAALSVLAPLVAGCGSKGSGPTQVSTTPPPPSVAAAKQASSAKASQDAAAINAKEAAAHGG